jgi:hypothetical protein
MSVPDPSTAPHVLLSHSIRGTPMPKSTPHLAFSRNQWPTLLKYLSAEVLDEAGLGTRDAALRSALGLLASASQVSCAMVDTPALVGLLSALTEGRAAAAAAAAADGGSSEEASASAAAAPAPPVPACTRLLALRCLRQCLQHAGSRSASLLQAVAPSLQAASCSPEASLREGAYAALEAAFTGSPVEGAAAGVACGFADSLVLRLLSELPEHDRGRPGLLQGALAATRALLESTGGRAQRAVPRALTSGAVEALLSAAALGAPSEATLHAALACLAALAGDSEQGRAALLAPPSAARLFPLLVDRLAHRGAGGSLRCAAAAAAALAALAVVDEGKRDALRAFGGLQCGQGGELPGPASAGMGLNALAQVLMDAAGGEGGGSGSSGGGSVASAADTGPPPAAAQAVLAVCGAIAVLSQHPTARFAFMAAANIKRQVFERVGQRAREGRYGSGAVAGALEKACTGAWDAVLWKP